MHRSEFIRFFSFAPLAGLFDRFPTRFTQYSDTIMEALRMPVLFIGHGSPMNAISDNAFSQSWEAIAAAIPEPKLILCISAHWETHGSFITAMDRPRTIHDFGGFPRELYEAQYPAPGDPTHALETQALLGKERVSLDQTWGLDHGTWSVLMKMYPAANIPVLQLSLDTRKSPREQYDLARSLAPMRRKGVLIMGSGNIVHNLRMADLREDIEPYDWAVEFDAYAAKLIIQRRHDELIDYENLGISARLSIPTLEHYLPLLYTLALQEDGDEVTFPTTGLAFRSGSMRSVRIG